MEILVNDNIETAQNVRRLETRNLYFQCYKVYNRNETFQSRPSFMLQTITVQY